MSAQSPSRISTARCCSDRPREPQARERHRGGSRSPQGIRTAGFPSNERLRPQSSAPDAARFARGHMFSKPAQAVTARRSPPMRGRGSKLRRVDAVRPSRVLRETARGTSSHSSQAPISPSLQRRLFLRYLHRADGTPFTKARPQSRFSRLRQPASQRTWPDHSRPSRPARRGHPIRQEPRSRRGAGRRAVPRP